MLFIILVYVAMIAPGLGYFKNSFLYKYM